MGIWDSLRRFSTRGTSSRDSSTKKRRGAGKTRLRERGLRMEQFEERMLLSIAPAAPVAPIAVWVDQGPGPAIDGQVENVSPNDEVVGAVHTLLAHPTDPDILYAGGVNGGIWKTIDATSASPTWTPLIDAEASLSIGAMQFDPTDPTFETIVAGVGRYSSFGRRGGDRTGLLRTTDGGTTWTALDGGGALAGKNISGIAARGDTIVVSVNSADNFVFSNTGIFRSTNGGATFTQISQGSGSANGLPGGVSYDLVSDPTNNSVLYTNIVFADLVGGANGLYKSTDTGATWAKVSDAPIDALISSTSTSNIELAVGNQNNVYVAVINTGVPAGFFRSGDGAATWTLMDTPQTNETSGTFGLNPKGIKGPGVGATPEELAGGQGSIHFSMVADPTDANIVYVGGDRQPGPPEGISWPNSIGALDYSGRLFRGDASLGAGSQWEHLTHSNNVAAIAGGGTASSSAPHADSREMVFDASGNLIEGDDGGIYRRTNPRTNTGDWYSIIGDLQITEMHDVAYDPISQIIISGNQDTGTTEQTAPGATTWQSVHTGDGGDVIVDSVSLAGSNQSIRYTSYQGLGAFRQRVVDANNNVVSTTFPALTVTSGAAFIGQFDTPVALNAVDPTRLMFGGANGLYESLDQGNTMVQVATGVVASGGTGNPIAYGGGSASGDNAEVVYVGDASGDVHVRTTLGGSFTATDPDSSSDGMIYDVRMDAEDWHTAFAVDDDQVFMTTTTAASWTDITGDIIQLGAHSFRSLEFVSGAIDAVVVGSGAGIFASLTSTIGTWFPLGIDLPNVPVWDLDYDPTDDVLVAGTLGRGAWTLPDASVSVGSANGLTQLYPELVLVIPQEGGFVDRGDTLNVAPRELVLRFNEGQEFIDETTTPASDPNGWLAGGRNGIQVTRSVNGLWGDGDDEIIDIGWIGIGDRPNDVVLRFAESLPDDDYRISVIGSDDFVGPDGNSVAPLLNTKGVKFREGLAEVDEHFEFELDLGAQVTAVVQQPVVTASAVITVSDVGDFADGDTFTLSDGKNSVVFEFTMYGGVTAGNVAIDLAGQTTPLQIAKAIDDAIFDASTLGAGVLELISSHTTPNTFVTVSRDSAVLGARVELSGTDLPFAVTETREQWEDVIEVYFNDDDLDPATAEDPKFYQLLVTQETASVDDDVMYQPSEISYDADLDRAILKFTDPLAVYGTGAFRLRIGNEYSKVTTTAEVSPSDAGSSFHSAQSLASFGAVAGPQSLIVSAAINPQTLLLEWPGAVDEPGHRDLPIHESGFIEDHYLTGDSSPDGTSSGIAEISYNFADYYGIDPSTGLPLYNNITEAQKDLARQIFALYAEYLGVSVVETASTGIQVVTGNLAVTGNLQSAPGGVGGVGGGNLAVMDQAESWGANEFGGSWFNVAMHEIGHCLGYGHAYDLAAGAIMGSAEDSVTGLNTEPVFPGDHDIVHGQHMYRQDSIDVDLYQIELDEAGTFNAEIQAERLNDSSLLDSVITVYRLQTAKDADGNTKIAYELIARNDDYYSKDSFVDLYLQPGTYFVGITASGNTDYDPNIENTGIGGSSQGLYKLRLTFTPGGVDPDKSNTFSGGTDHLLDTSQVKFDGDADGVPGGAFNYWFDVQSETVFVDKTSTSPILDQDGSLANPYTTIQKALTDKGGPDTIIRVLGNNFYNDDPNDLSTYDDNVPYQIGQNPDTFQTLEDGRWLEVPQDVTLIVDAGAVFKLSSANVDVGSAAEGIDRSGGSLQVLGTPDNSVIFTSFRDADIGIDIDPSNNTPEAGDWGGLVFRNELDYDFVETYDPASGLAAREVLESQGIFLNYVNHADIRYGGGVVEVDGVRSVYAPIYMNEARPTVTNNRITMSADAALSADPNSFADTRFQSWDAVAPFTARYNRVGPEVRGNYIVDNTTNGMFVRISTAAGSDIDELELAGRFDDWDVVHVIAENLFVAGTAGGPMQSERTNPLTLLDSNRIQAISGSWIPDQDTFTIFDGSTRVVFEFDLGAGVAPGHIAVPYTLASTATQVADSIQAAINQAVTVYGLDISATSSSSVVTLTNTGPLVQIEGFGTYDARLDARLQVDPGVIVKMDGSRIEMGMGAQLIAEGRVGSDDGPGYRAVFTSLLDNRYGASGSFDTSSITSGDTATPGDWGGLYFSPTSSGSINHAIVAYAGGVTAIEGGFANFNVVEIRQAEVRIANSRFESNAADTAGDRNGRGPSNAATIQVRGAQPVIVSNDFIDNEGAVLSIDLNSLASEIVVDWGRTTSFVSVFEEYAGNHGPLIGGNRMTNNTINGMEVRGGILTTDSVWDDTDIVHVLYDEIEVPNYHHEGVLRLQSSDTQSLVVKLLGASAGFTAGGEPLEIDDRIGGTVQVLGQPGHPVVLTSVRDDSVGAGFTLGNLPQNDTNNDGNATSPSPGDWRSVLIDTYSNDRNVAVVNEIELSYGMTSDANGYPGVSQALGSLASEDKAGDDNLRLGFEVHGTIRTDAPTDADVYTFNAFAGTEIWIDIDRSKYALDLVVELITADGTVLARSDNSYFEELAGDVEDLSTEAYTMNRDAWLRHDFYTINTDDPGLRLVLPGPAGAERTYYVRVRSVLAIGAIPAADDIYDGTSFSTGTLFTVADEYMSFTFEFTPDGSVSDTSYVPVLLPSGIDASSPTKMAEAIVAAVADAQSRGLGATARVIDGTVAIDGLHVRFNALDTSLTHLANTSGEYQLQIRLEEMQEIPGSTVQYADIRYATNGIEVYGQPGHSPLLGESAEVENGNQNANDTVGQAQQIGNLLQVDRNAISVSGYLEDRTDVDWYAMSVDMGGVQSIPGVSGLGSVWATIFDIDYADQMSRPDLNIWVFDSNRNLVLAGGSSSIADDRPEPIPNATIEDLSRGSIGARDPFIGSALLAQGDGNTGVYYIAVTSTLAIPAELNPVTSPLTRREPLESVNRIASEHFDTLPYNRINTSDPDFMGVRLDPIPYDFTLSDTILYVNTGSRLYTVDPFTGAFETDVTRINNTSGLPNSGSTLWYDDISMRNDGRLFTIESGNSGGGFGRNGADTLMLSTEDARNTLQRNDTGITFYEINPQTPTALRVDGNGGIRFEAMVQDYDLYDRNMYAVGNAQHSIGSGYDYENLMYVLDPAGVAYTHPSILNGSRAGGARAISGEKVPTGRLFTAPTIVVTSAFAIPNGSSFTVTYNDPGAGTSRTVAFTFDNTVTTVSQTGPDAWTVGIMGMSSETQVANQISNAINVVTGATFNINATWSNGDVRLPGIAVNDINLGTIPSTAMRTAGDAGNGGSITGLAYIDSQMYAVSDAGDLFMVDNEHGNPASSGTYGYSLADPDGSFNYIRYNFGGPRLTYVASLQYSGTPISFSGLTAGPDNVEDGAYQDTLFATDSGGRLYALDLDGNLRPIFNDGAERLQLDASTTGSNLTGVRGVAFSPIDFNLWHMTRNREHDLGHGVTTTHDGVRNGELGYGPGSSQTEGDLSMYFGLEDPTSTPGIWDQPIGVDFERGPSSANIDTAAYDTYDLPGGAHGTFTTTPFSLDGYSSLDEPTLYFNYFAETENSDNWDGTRVYISNDGANWDLVSTNTDTNDGNRRAWGLYQEMETPTEPTRIIDEIVDTGGAWRQARIDLSRYAGQDNLTLRFDFSTASDMEIGDLGNGTQSGNQHHYVAPVPAYELTDGDTFTVTGQGSPNQTFEFDLGLALVLPNVAGAAIGDGEWFEVDDGLGAPGSVVQFEFDKDSSVSGGRTAISITDTMSTAEVIQEMIFAINPKLDVEGLAANPEKDPNRLFLARAMDLDVSGAPHLIIQGNTPGTVSGSNIRIPIRGDMDLIEVGDVIKNVVNQQLDRTIDTAASGAVTTKSPEVLRVPSTNFSWFSLEATTARGETRTVEFIRFTGSATPWVINDSLVAIGMGGVAPGDTATAAQRIADAINAAATGASSTQPELVVSAFATTRSTGASIIGVGDVLIDVVEFDLSATPFTSFTNAPDTNVVLTTDVHLWSDRGEIINADWDTDVDAAAGDAVHDLLHLYGHSLTSWGPLAYSGSGGWNFGFFGELEGEETANKNNYGPGRDENRFNLQERGQNNNFEGFYIDDIIVGFAERGELVTNASQGGTLTNFDNAPLPNPNLYPSEYPIVTEGSYQLEVRSGANYAYAVGGASYPITLITETWDTNDRMADEFTVIVPAADEIHHGQWFELSDGRDDITLRFVFVDTAVGGGAGFGNVRIDFSVGDTADIMALSVATAINQAKVDGKFNITGRAIDNSDRVDLFGAVRLWNDPAAYNPLTTDFYPTTGGDATFDGGDSNLERDKGQITISGNTVAYSANTGIVVAPSRDTSANWAHPASGLTMNDPNELVGGIMIENNLVTHSGQIGIDFRGTATNSSLPIGAIPFGRIANNTVYGGSGTGIGIDVGPNASPTLLNNIVASLNTGIRIDTSSAQAGTVVGGSLYKNNVTNLQGAVAESFGVYLNPSEPLFVDAAGGNFYLDHGSQAIDSSINALEERQDYFNTILQPVGIPVSPIIAPETDLYGQLRRDDPSVASPVGLGSDVYKDRGAIDRVDFVAPTSQFTVPLDNGPKDKLGLVANDLKLVGEKVLKFTIQLKDSGGVGIDDASVITTAIHLYRDLDETTYLDPLTRDPELVDGIDYKMVYNATNDTIDLIPLSGIWPEGYDYTIVLDGTIRDQANNSLQPNRYSGTFNGLTVFEISLAGLDFGDAPDGPYQTLLDNNGPRHIIYGDFQLGAGINSETDARTGADADGDAFDDGVSIPGSGLLKGETGVPITLDVTFQNQNLIDQYGSDAVVYGWFDFDDSKTFDLSERFVKTVQDGLNTMYIDVPDTVSVDKVVARFRLGTVDSLGGDDVSLPYGDARDGEVEDYVFPIVQALNDYGDAPASYPVTGAASHSVKSATVPDTTVFLGTVAPDSELNGIPTPNAMGDDLDRADDEDGVDFTNILLVAGNSYQNTIDVTVSSTTGATAYVNAWLDMDMNGNWEPGEQFIFGTTNGVVDFGGAAGTVNLPISFEIPAMTAEQAVSYARFRVSYDDDLDVASAAEDGEVEDYQVFMVNEARDYGDAPDNLPGLPDYPTLLSSNGAYHTIDPAVPLALGTVDRDFDGQPNATATGDDLNYPANGADDEDGVVFAVNGTDALSRFVPGGVALVDVDVASGSSAYLYGWVDFNRDGDWDDMGEQVFGDATSGLVVQPGSNILSINIPELFDPTDPTAISELGDTYSRFRLTTASSGVSYDGPAANGEVEDHLVTIEIGDATIQGKKFNDLDADGVYDSSVQGTIPEIELGTIGLGPTVIVDTDNGWSTQRGLGFNFEYFGNTYNSLYVSPNGLVSFDYLSTFDPMTNPGFPSNSAVIAPFWADADLTQSGGSVHMSNGVSQRGNPFVQIDWNNVGYYDRASATNQNLRNTFSLYIEDAPAGDIVAFVYDTMQWTTGDLGGSGGFGGSGAEIGFSAGGQFHSEMRPDSQQGLNALFAAADNGVLGYRLDPTTGLLVEGEPGLPGVTVYLDYDGNEQHDPNEPMTVTRQDDLSTPGIDETGEFEFTGLFSGSYQVRELVEDGWVQTYPSDQLGYLPDVNGNKILAVDGSDIIDGDTFLVSDGTLTLAFEFEEVNLLNGTSPGAIPVEFDAAMDANAVALKIAEAIDSAGMELETAVVSGDLVTLNADTTVNPLASVSIDPQTTMLVILGNSSINESAPPKSERYYTVEVGAGETFSDVLFGNHELATISMGDASVAEGADGESTVVEVVFERRGSFGAPVRVDFHTEDGTATVADNDYIPRLPGGPDSYFVFGPQDEPQATWDIQSVTHNQTNDYDYHVAGDSMVFEVADGNDWEILVYNNTVGGDPVALTDNLTEDRFADLHRVGSGDSGKIYAVWAGVDPAVGQNDYEIFFTEVEVTPTGLNVGDTVQVTHNTTDDKSPRVSDSHVTWWGYDAAGDTEIYLQDIATIDTPSVVNISNNDYDDYDPVIEGDRVVWHSLVSQGTEIFLWDGAIARRITNNQADNSAPQISGNNIVWQGRDGGDYEVFLYEIDTWTTTQLTFDAFEDVTPQVSGDSIVWQGGSPSNREVLIYNVVDGGTPSNISNSFGLDERPQIYGEQIVWHAFDGFDWEVMFYDLTTPFLPLNVSNNMDYDWGPQLSDELLVWRSNDGQDYEIVVASQNDPVARQTVQLTIVGDSNIEDDEDFKVVVDSAAIDGVTLNIDPKDMVGDRDEGTIGIYNDDGQLDFGDAPASYHTLIADNGPRHMTAPGDTVNLGYYLGTKIDSEADGRPSANADGDDGWISDDEDGVTIRSHWLPGGIVHLSVVASKDGYFEGWADYNADGNFGDDAGNEDSHERLIFTDQNGVSSDSIALTAGESLLTVQVPENATLGRSYARFRFSKDGGLSYLGSSRNGEVEDYAIDITTDKPGVTFISADNKVAIEGGAGDTYRVVLDAEPTQTVYMTITGDADVTTTPTTLKFTRDNWDVSQIVTIVAVDDDIAELAGDNIGTLTHTIDSLDLAYRDLVIDTIPVEITDNDLAKVQVIRTGGSTRVREDGTLTDTYELALTSEPVGVVTVSVDAGSQLFVSATPGGTPTQTLDLVFTPLNWNIRQVVYVTAVDDDVAEGNPDIPLANREHSANITHTVSSHSGSTILDPKYDALGSAVDMVIVQIGDNDSPGVDIQGVTGTVFESGTGSSYQVKLTSEPTQNVVVHVTPDSQLETDVDSLLFTPANWSTPQTVTVTAVDDDVAEGVHSGEVSHAVDSLDPFYTGLTANTVTVVIDDIGNDTADVEILDGGSLDVSEGGQTDTYQVRLTSEPTADVTVNVGSGSQLNTNVDTLTFTPSTWNTPQTITVSAFDDDVAEGQHTAALGHTLQSDDPNYHHSNLSVPLRTVNITDNDSADVEILPSGTTLTVVEGGATAQYTIALTSRPTSKVIITLAGGDQIDVIPQEIVFDASDWSQPRDVTVRALNDAVAEGPHSTVITHSVSSADGNYQGLPVDNIPVDITDNDTAGITITETAGSTDISEAGQTDIYTVALQSQPTSDVTIQIQTGGQAKTLPSSLTFTAQNWSQPQTVAVTPVADIIAEGPHTDTIVHVVSSSDPNYSGLTPASLVVNITDDDVHGIVVTETGGGSAVTEGGATDDYTVALASQPSANVTVTVMPDDEVSTLPTQLTFTPTNWNQPQAVTVTAVDDLDDEPAELAQISHSVTSQDPMYNGVAATSVFVEVTDNDEPGPIGTLDIPGTAGDDSLEVIRGDALTVRLNGVLQYQGTQVHTVTFDGLGGYDDVTVTGSDDSEQAIVNPNALAFTGTNFSVTAVNIEETVLEGGGGSNFVQMTDSAGNDTVTGSPTQVTMAGTGFRHEANHFQETQLYARNGGQDTLALTDSAGKDKAKVEAEDTAKLYSSGANYFIRGKFFEDVSITSTGGTDSLRIWDTAADDTVSASHEEVVVNTGSNLADPGLRRQTATIRGFENASVFATVGGFDTLNLLDSAGDDKAVLRSHKVQLYNLPSNPNAYEITGRSFDEVHATATTGNDIVRVHDTADVDLLTASFVGGKSWASLQRPVNATDMALMYDATGFDTVNAVNDYQTNPKNQKDVDSAVDFLMLDEAHWDEI